MEGWLIVPPTERNLIGRAAWKMRYVRFSDGLPSPIVNGHRTSSSVGSSIVRPTTASSTGSITHKSLIGSSGRKGTGLERSHSTHQVSALGSSAAYPPTSSGGGGGGGSGGSGSAHTGPWTLAVYKQKHDVEPIARYPISKIAACYVGDIASHKRRSLVQPTLIINLRNDPPPPPSSSTPSRSFRRRSQDVTASGERMRREGAAGTHTTLLFRPSPENPTPLDMWAKEIQSRLLQPRSSVRGPRTNGTDGGFYGRFREDEDYDYVSETSPTSMFIVNGEPNTALLSPSIRSRNSNLSSIESLDDKISSSYVSSASELVMPSPRIPDEGWKRPQSSAASGSPSRPVLHLRTTSSRRPSDGTPSLSSPEPEHQHQHQQPQPSTVAFPPPPPPPPPPRLPSPRPPARHETILDRYFSTAPSSPTSDGKPMSSMARFEALMNDLEKGKDKSSPSSAYHSHMISRSNTPKRPPSPATQRVLDYVSTGRTPSPGLGPVPSPNYCTSAPLPPPRPPALNSQPTSPRQDDQTSPRSSFENVSPSRRNSSDTMQSSITNSSAGGIHVLAPRQAVRHSVADFSFRSGAWIAGGGLAPPLPHARRRSLVDEDEMDDDGGGVPVRERSTLLEGEFGEPSFRGASRAGGRRGIFREFSF